MIVHLDKEQERKARRQAMNDVVYIICHDVLRAMKREGKTALQPVEVFLTSQNFCRSLLCFPDMEEALDEEMDDLEEEAETEDDFMLIMTVVAVQLQAMSKRHEAGYKQIIFRIFQRLDGYTHLLTVVAQMTDKEDARWLEGKKSSLLSYELKEIQLNNGDAEDVRKLFEELVSYADQSDVNTIKEILLFLNHYNIEHHHAYDAEIRSLEEKLDIKCKLKQTIEGDLILSQSVDKQVAHVAAGGVGIQL